MTFVVAVIPLVGLDEMKAVTTPKLNSKIKFEKISEEIKYLKKFLSCPSKNTANPLKNVYSNFVDLEEYLLELSLIHI